jgi:hypothetical protein
LSPAEALSSVFLLLDVMLRSSRLVIAIANESFDGDAALRLLFLEA